jgi:hypothetical protein
MVRRSVLLALALAWGGNVASAQAETAVFSYTGAEQTFTVPEGVTSLQVTAVGAIGGDRDPMDAVPAAAAARVSGDLEVTPGQTLYVEVGGKGEDHVAGEEGGFNGGGDGDSGGGGASDVRTMPLAAGLSPDPRLIVAAGGGGAGGTYAAGEGGAGGAAGSPGSEGVGSGGVNLGGAAGTGTAGGLGGAGCANKGVDGELGLGGDGGTSNIGTASDGGGGGGGYYGGGGGGGGACALTGSGSGGGGGGSSLVPAGGILEVASVATPSQVQIGFTPSPPVTGPGTGNLPAPAVSDTLLGPHPKKRIKTPKKRVKVTFGFSSTVAGATFECKLDRGRFTPCTSPATYRVKPGTHSFSVIAVDAGGADPTPASFRFKVKRKK